MKEFKSIGEIIEAHYPVPRKHQRTKRWTIAITKNKRQALENSCVEASYHQVIDTVKKLYMQDGEVYYDRDQKTDKTENFLAMHNFITPTFYWYLECDFCYDYRIEYAFNNCPLEAEIRTMMQAYPLDRRATEVNLQPNFTTFYRMVLSIQEKQFIHSFKREPH